MRVRGYLIVVGMVVAAVGCATEERDWMKLNERYTTEDFRRDLKACTRNDKLDEACMQRLGWVSVSKGRDEKPADPTQPSRPRYR